MVLRAHPVHPQSDRERINRAIPTLNVRMDGWQCTGEGVKGIELVDVREVGEVETGGGEGQ